MHIYQINMDLLNVAQCLLADTTAITFNFLNVDAINRSPRNTTSTELPPHYWSTLLYLALWRPWITIALAYYTSSVLLILNWFRWILVATISNESMYTRHRWCKTDVIVILCDWCNYSTCRNEVDSIIRWLFQFNFHSLWTISLLNPYIRKYEDI